MHDLILFAAATENPIQEISRTFGFNVHHFVAQVVSFLIVAGLLYKFAYQKVLNVLEERRAEIASGLANAEKIKSELARTEASRLEILNQANTQANKLIEEARAAAARVQEIETQKAIATATDIVTKAKQAAEAEHVRMLADLKREVGRLVVDTTGKVTGKILSMDDQKRLTEETNKQLAA
ncbi:MAG: F0F1 ATP synthase subunit B [Verrucomicrobiota bacterium]